MRLKTTLAALVVALAAIFAEGGSPMLSKLRSQVTYANVVSSVCLFIVLGGTSYAVATGSIGSREIKNNSIRGKDIRTGTIRSSDVGDGSLLAGDFKVGQLPAGARGAQGPAGPQGLRGPAGPRGSAGQDGFGELVYPDNAETVAKGVSAEVTVGCPAGTSATGGDAFVNDATDKDVTNQVVISQGFRFTDPIGWFASVTNNTGGDVLVTVDAACANADSVNASPSKNRRLHR